jgi:hypothetical protein
LLSSPSLSLGCFDACSTFLELKSDKFFVHNAK